MSSQDHWQKIYESKQDAQLSWTQPEPRLSMDLIRSVCPAGRVIDVGGGASVLAGRLVTAGHSVAVLDISSAALARARETLASRATDVRWIVEDVTSPIALESYDVWHDRAVFHFLTEAADRAAYIALLSRTIATGGHAIIATFSLHGPEKCSGLPIRRYDSDMLAAEVGSGFRLLRGCLLYTSPSPRDS